MSELTAEQILQHVYDGVTQALKVNAGLTVTGDIEIGAAEIKDGATDTRAVVTTSPAQDTDAGLVVRLPRRGTLTDRSGTITAGNTAQQAMAANSGRRYLFVYNPPTATESLWINFTATAAKDQPSIELGAGASFVQEDMFVTTELVSIIAATTGHKFVAKEG